MPAEIELRPMTAADHAAVFLLWQASPGVVVREADDFEATARYLQRNPGLSFVAEIDGRIVGCLMAGHDGRRGYLQHLTVLPACRRRGIATALVQTCLAALAHEGIGKAHLDILAGNRDATAFWQAQGWQARPDLERYSLTLNGHANA